MSKAKLAFKKKTNSLTRAFEDNDNYGGNRMEDESDDDAADDRFNPSKIEGSGRSKSFLQMAVV